MTQEGHDKVKMSGSHEVFIVQKFTKVDYRRASRRTEMIVNLTEDLKLCTGKQPKFMAVIHTT